MSRIFRALTFILLTSGPLFGFNYFNGTNNSPDKQLIVKGRVVDADTKATIEFAIIQIFNYPDTIPIQITSTDDKGEFNFKKLRPGNFAVKVSFMGFTNFTTQPFNLKAETPVFQIDPISLQINSQSLGEITIHAHAGNTSYRLDKKTIYVENQISGAGGSASDLLYKLPSVTQSPDGRLAIHGNTNLLIYVNGKPSSLKGNELLENTSAAEIKKIELITSPSAKYDASGSGGIINLITKKSTQDGFNGNILVAADQLGGYSADFLLNYKFKKFSFFTGIDNNKRKNKGDVDYITEYPANLTQFSQTGIQKSQRTNTGFRTGADYQPSKFDKIAVSGNVGTFETNNNGDWQTHESELLLENSPDNSVTNNNNRLGNYGGADATYEHKFKSPDKSVSISTLWNTLEYDDQFLNLITDGNGTEQMKQTTLLDKRFNTWQFNTDYSTRAGKAGILELGYQITINKEQENYQSNKSVPPPTVITNQETRFKEEIQAGYGTWQFNLERMELKAGLRAEYLNRDLTTLQKSYPLHRFDFYPSLNSSFQIDSVQSILFNYTRRTDHLKTIQLDPLPRWYDFYNVMVGNPNLQYEITDKISLDYLVRFQNLTLASELFFYNTANKIEVIRSIFHDNIIQNRLENVGIDKTIGFELNASWLTTGWLTLNQKLDIIDSRLDVSIDTLTQRKNYQQLYSVTSANFTISPTMSLEADFSYFGPAMTAQTTVDACYLAGLSVRKTFFTNKLTFTLTGRDGLRLYKKVEHIQGGDFEQTVTTANYFPFRFSVSYKFNNYKRDERKIAKSPPAE